MHCGARVLLADIEQASADIAHFIEGVSREADLQDGLIQATVGRKFEIIGEVLNRLDEDHREIVQRIQRLRRNADFRSLPSHGYDRVTPERV